MLVFAIQQSESAISMHIPPRVLDFLPIWLPQSSKENSLCYTVGSSYLFIYFISYYFIIIYFMHSNTGVYAIFIIPMLPFIYLVSL